jgi:hypothetical protein
MGDQTMKPWQAMILVSISMAVLCSILSAFLPSVEDKFALTVGMASAIVLIGMFVMRPPENKNV